MSSRQCSVLALCLGQLRVLGSSPADACRCVEPSAARAYADGDVVVLGSVESIETDGDLSIATFAVERAWKRDVAERIKIAFGRDCSFPLETSGRYLIYARRAVDGSFGTRRCRGDQAYANAGQKIAWLRKHGKASAVVK
jgi:hypothetical protein